MTQYRGGAGNFANDRQRASEAGKKGGQRSGGNFKTIRRRRLKRGARAVRTATAEAVNPPNKY